MRTGEPIYAQMRSTVNAVIKEFLESEKEHLTPALDLIRREISGEYVMTFGRFDLLRRFAPWKFKNAMVYATHFDEGEIKRVEFSTDLIKAI